MTGVINIVVLVLLLSFASALPAAAASLDELSPYLSVQQYQWEEFGEEGRRLLEESGQLVAGGVVVGGKTDRSLTFRGKFELFGGSVDYDGETQGADPIPVKTDVNYFGMKNQFDLGYRISRPAVSIEPFAGVAHRWWVRDLEDSESGGVAVSGYSEVWQTGYARLGARARYQPPAPVALFVEAGALYPFYTGNTVDFEGSGETTFRPDGRVSAFGEAGAQWRQLRVSLYYEGFRWSKSPVKAVGSQFFYQPRSEADIYGLSIGWAFR